MEKTGQRFPLPRPNQSLRDQGTRSQLGKEPMGFRRIAIGLVAFQIVAATASLAEVIPPPLLTNAEVKCQRNTLTGTIDYVRRVFGARQACFDAVTREQLPPTTDCRAPLDVGTGYDPTDDAIGAAEAALAVAIQLTCQNIHLENLGFPGLCPDPFGPPYDSFDHEQCMLDRSNALIDDLLAIEHPPFPGPFLLKTEDAACQDTLSLKSSDMFWKEVESRTTLCEMRRFEREIEATVNCRAELDPLLPGTGDTTVDENLFLAHNDVLRGIANACKLADLTLLGFPHACPNPDGSLFSIAALTECMYDTHHFNLIDFVDGMVPLTKVCGNCQLEPENGEGCDDGDNEWTRGEFCRHNCSIITTCGDPDDSGGITIRDALYMLRAAVGLEQCHPSICDINGDGVVNTTDALLALRAVVGLPIETKCNPPDAGEVVCAPEQQ